MEGSSPQPPQTFTWCEVGGGMHPKEVNPSAGGL
jgi:hypothetical protein